MRKLIGDKKFYKMVLAIAVPIMVQNGITNFLGFLDNIMIGTVGTDQMSGVSIVNQLIFVFNLCIFGAISGAGIFGAQFFGQKNHEGVRNTFRFKVIICAILTLLAIFIFRVFDTKLISLYLHEGGSTGNIPLTLQYAKEYLLIMLIGLIPFAIIQCYAGTLREVGQTILPMKAGIVAVTINFVLNCILIFGLLGFPKLGVKGAAIATVIARFFECAIVVVWTHKNRDRNVFIRGAYESFAIPIALVKQIIIKGTPLLMNEFLWAAGMAVLTQCYSVKGLAIVAGLNISSTIANIFNIVFIAIGSSVAIIVGQLLGAGKFEEAQDTAYKIITFSVLLQVILGAIMFLTAPLLPSIYNTTEEAKTLATNFIRVISFMLPIQACLHATYFTIRSGGKTVITFLFDSAYVWVISIPFAYFLVHKSLLPIVVIYLLVQLMDFIKVAIGFVMLKKGIWLSDIVSEF